MVTVCALVYTSAGGKASVEIDDVHVPYSSPD
jgi:hypothetical protein